MKLNRVHWPVAQVTSLILVEECIRQQRHQPIHPLCVLLLALVSMLLHLGVGSQCVQPFHLGALGLSAQRLAVDLDQA